MNLLETPVQKLVRLKASLRGMKLFRNNVGAYKLPSGKWLHYGLKNGSGDLIGWESVIITQEMVGKTIARFTSIETKRSKGGTLEEDQINWMKQVNAAGGNAIVARSPDDVV